MPATLANSRFDRNPRRTTSRALNTCGNVRTCEASSSIIRPSASSPRTGKKFSSVRMFSCRTAWSPEGFGCRLLAKASKIFSVRSGAKSKMYAFCFWNTVPGALEGAGVLRPERRLHVLRRRRQVGQHDDRRPLGHRDARRELADRQGDGLAACRPQPLRWPCAPCRGTSRPRRVGISSERPSPAARTIV